MLYGQLFVLFCVCVRVVCFLDAFVCVACDLLGDEICCFVCLIDVV